jgi:hypothetical protein
MGNVSKITDTARFPLTIDVFPYLRDHRFQGRAVLPAVESMRLMAASVSAFRPKTDTRLLTNAKFIKFLYIQPQDKQINAFTEITINTDGLIIARLITKTSSPHSGFARVKEHAVIHFNDNKDQDAETTDALEFIKPDKDFLDVSAEIIYRELVPFGPSYHNLTGNLTLFKKGADATIHSPDYPVLSNPLGSPFILDAAFHAACVWGQRYTDIVGFPVGFEKRIVFQPTQLGQTYRCRIAAVKTKPDMIKFNIWIYKENNELFESILGVEMRDVSAGKLKPPAWLQEDVPRNSIHSGLAEEGKNK